MIYSFISHKIEYNESIFVAIGCPDHLRYIINEPRYPEME